MAKFSWRRTNAKLVFEAAVFIFGLWVSLANGGIWHGNVGNRLLSLIGTLCFVIAATTFLHTLSSGVRKTIIRHRLGVGRAAALQFIIRTFGYLAILFTTLDLVGVPVGHILVGSALLGIILGVAAQQALANFFASIVLIIVHPFAVGQRITLYSGALGKYVGTVDDIGLTHTKIREDSGNVVELPNSPLLTGAAITVHKHSKVTEAEPALAQ